MTYSTGDDSVIEVVIMVMAVSLLITWPAYLDAVPLPEAWTVVLTVLAGCVAFYISGGRVFWAVIWFLGSLFTWLGVIKPEEAKEADYTIEYDAEGRPVKVEKKDTEKEATA